jgi:hypothetical protein
VRSGSECGVTSFVLMNSQGTGNWVGRLRRRIVEEVGKRQSGYGVLKWRHWLLHSVTCKIHPFQKVSDLVSAVTRRDFQHGGGRRRAILRNTATTTATLRPVCCAARSRLDSGQSSILRLLPIHSAVWGTVAQLPDQRDARV